MTKRVRPRIKLENGIWHCKDEQCIGLGYTIHQAWYDYNHRMNSRIDSVNYEQFLKVLGA